MQKSETNFLEVRPSQTSAECPEVEALQAPALILQDKKPFTPKAAHLPCGLKCAAGTCCASIPARCLKSRVWVSRFMVKGLQSSVYSFSHALCLQHLGFQCFRGQPCERHDFCGSGLKFTQAYITGLEAGSR